MLHRKVPTRMWTTLFVVVNVQGGVPRTVKSLLEIGFKGLGGYKTDGFWWGCVVMEIWWVLWTERIASIFNDRRGKCSILGLSLVAFPTLLVGSYIFWY